MVILTINRTYARGIRRAAEDKKGRHFHYITRPGLCQVLLKNFFKKFFSKIF